MGYVLQHIPFFEFSEFYKKFKEQRNFKKFKNNVKGIAIGEFKDIENTDLLDEVISEFALRLNIPVISGFKITHGKIKDTLPVGVFSELNTQNYKITILEDYVI